MGVGSRATGPLGRPTVLFRHARVSVKPRRGLASYSAARATGQGPTVQAASNGGSGKSSANGSSSSSSNVSGTGTSTSNGTGSISGTAASPHPSASGKAPASAARRRNTDLALIVAGSLGLSALLFYNLRNNSRDSSPASLSTLSPSSKSFTLPVQTQAGLEWRTIQMFSPNKVNEILRANEKSYSVTRPGNPLYRYDTNSVASNPTCEDAQSFTILEHEGTDYILASVFDGHSGFWTSRYMSDKLEKYIARELFEVLRGNYRSLTVSGDSWWNWLWHMGTPKAGPSQATRTTTSQNGSSDSAGPRILLKLDDHMHIVPEALRNAYKLADRDVINPPMDYLKSLEATSSSSPLHLTDTQRQQGLALLQPALSGSCSLSLLLDTSSSALYVALSGDSRAVMGTFDAETRKWRAEVLSEDQTGRSAKEVERMKREHPKNEEETVIMRGRVLGGLEPTRSFGDGRYKFPLGVQEKLISAFKPTNARVGAPRNYKTPPYVTAEPEVTTFRLADTAQAPPTSDELAPSSSVSATSTPLSQSTPSHEKPASGCGRRFIVMATDGLYDCLSSEEVVALVAGHLDGFKGDKMRGEVMDQLSTPPTPGQGILASPHKPREEKDSGKRYTFEDENLGTHLVRNALGGAQREHVSALLSIPAAYSRRYRDDITVTVLLLGDRQTAVSSGMDADEKLVSGVRRLYTQPARSKL